jgi:hypothetical protein
VEKFQDWADVYDAFSDDDIITLVMMHWIQGATPALRFYRFPQTRRASQWVNLLEQSQEFEAWSFVARDSRSDLDVYDAFSDDDIITLVMMHWIQGATPALRFYREALDNFKAGRLPKGLLTWSCSFAYMLTPVGAETYVCIQ